MEEIKFIFLMIIGIGLIGFILLYTARERLAEKNSNMTQTRHDSDLKTSTDDIYIISYKGGNLYPDSGSVRFCAMGTRKDGDYIIFKIGYRKNVIWDTSKKNSGDG